MKLTHGTRGALTALLLSLLLTTCTTQESEESLELQEENNTVSTESPETVSSDITIVSPHRTWIVFRDNSNKGGNKKPKGNKRLSKDVDLTWPGQRIPRIPDFVRVCMCVWNECWSIARKADTEMVGTYCLLCDQPPRVATAFRCRLHHNLLVHRRSLQELQPFNTPLNTEQFHQRGQGFNASSGRYTAPVSGFYQLTASLLLESNESQKKPNARQRDSVKTSICIESLCQSNVSLETVTGVSATGGVFSILLTGTLYLQAGEYVSILIDNGTGSALTILQNSLFSGILFGI
ncbi:Erythroferrone [Anabarilius grahami]|uniref:Adipolin n=1 Tax=Anabarilius grahami TaxID=495550 RepID=A0A3N0YS03_ANAGA|nr:Erythroferrone [Anabarilius grahami]